MARPKDILGRVPVPAVPEEEVQKGGCAEAQPEDEVDTDAGARVDSSMASPCQDADALCNVPDKRDAGLQEQLSVRFATIEDSRSNTHAQRERERTYRR